MQQIKRTIGFYFSHSYVTLISIILLAATLMPMQIILPGNSGEPERILSFLLMSSCVIGSFIGIYFAGGMLKLKQHYLWAINPYYRNVLISAFLILVIVYSAIQASVMSINLPRLHLLLFTPFCAAMFSAFTVLGKSLLHKTLIPSAPILLGLTVKLGVPPNVILLLIIGASVGLVYYLFEVDRDKVKTAKETLQAVGIGESATLPPIVAKINHAIGRHLTPMIKKSRKDVSWAICLPYFKLGLVPLTYLVFIIPLSLMGDNEKSILEVFTVMMTASTLISLIGESRKLMPQIKPVAHTFIGPGQIDLKNRILRAVDFLIVKNCTILVASVIVLAELLSIEYNFKLIVLQSILVVGVGLAFSPGFLSLRWINVSLVLVTALASYAGVIILAGIWLSNTPSDQWFSLPAFIYVGSLIALRLISKTYFAKLPMESLLKVK
ncbi:hypothetical protein FLL45_09160 [Aliikangiella marina]|uniref:Uncharacterized protein n=1 Tax=Aliikangiella marina TaxID=1712262 RepID=A0A545TD11_9GAMM|nr:hypothetical protein [Aliikangiella marina]TQV75099.1 hypothetical protein FLL45_09160 [Aliikangiella marina]